MEKGDEIDPETLSISDLLNMATESDSGSFVVECKDEIDEPLWAVVALQGEGVGELIQAVQAALTEVHNRWEKEEAEQEEETIKN